MILKSSTAGKITLLFGLFILIPLLLITGMNLAVINGNHVIENIAAVWLNKELKLY
jgi:hypothetical protein